MSSHCRLCNTLQRWTSLGDVSGVSSTAQIIPIGAVWELFGCVSFLRGAGSHLASGVYEQGSRLPPTPPPPTTAAATVSNHPRPLFTSLISASPGTKRCSELRPLVYQRSTEQRRAIIIIIIIIAGAQHGEAAAARTRRAQPQPISGLVSLQHLGGSEACERTLGSSSGGGGRLRASATRKYARVNLPRRWRINDNRSLKLMVFF